MLASHTSFTLRSACKPKSATCAATADCCAGLVCGPNTAGGSVCAAQSSPPVPGPKAVAASVGARGAVTLTLTWPPPADKGAASVAILAYKVTGWATNGANLSKIVMQVSC